MVDDVTDKLPEYHRPYLDRCPSRRTCRRKSSVTTMVVTTPGLDGCRSDSDSGPILRYRATGLRPVTTVFGHHITNVVWVEYSRIHRVRLSETRPIPTRKGLTLHRHPKSVLNGHQYPGMYSLISSRHNPSSIGWCGVAHRTFLSSSNTTDPPSYGSSTLRPDVLDTESGTY